MVYYVVALFVSFSSVFLKGLQYKNVAGNHFKLVAVTSYLMALSDVLTVGLIIKSDWTISIPCGIGSAAGMVLSMKFHDKIFARTK